MAGRMKNKRIVSVLLTAVLVLLVGTVQAETAKVPNELSRTGRIQTSLTADEAERGYISRLFGLPVEEIRLRGSAAGAGLTDTETGLYQALKNRVAAVAAGELSSTVFEFSGEEFDDHWYSAEELGAENVNSAIDLLWEQVCASVEKVVTAVSFDCPYELYWMDPGYEVVPEIQVSPDSLIHMTVTLKIRVSADYAPNGTAGGFTVNPGLIQGVQAAVVNAREIVDRYDGLRDYDKLAAYRDAVCELASYNYAAVEEETDYGNPRQLVWVFDGDPETNVVCEGYSKAFQYLCDMSCWDGDVEVISVSGLMYSGEDLENGTWEDNRHMWNIVTMDGVHYLADITNSDEGSAGEGGGLFLNGCLQGSEDGTTFICQPDGQEFYYTFDEQTLAAFQETGVLALAETAAVRPESDISWEVIRRQLRISGTGDIPDYPYPDPETGSMVYAPWDLPDAPYYDNIVIEEGITGVGSNAFYCYQLTSVTLPSTVTRIGNGAFANCVNLVTVNFPEGLTRIGSSAFSYCPLDSADFPDSLVRIGSEAFYGCAITEVSFPAGLQSIGNSAFADCDNLMDITLPGIGTQMGFDVFRGCGSLRIVTLPEDWTEVPVGIFSSCDSLTGVSFPAGITRIGDDAFSRCSSLTEIDLPEQLTEIGDYAFSWCRNLAGITIPETVQRIGDGAFYQCDGLTEVTIPGGEITIGNEAFSGCSQLTRVHFEGDVASIGDYAFSCGSAMEDIVFPGNVGSIGQWAFSGMENVTVQGTLGSMASGALSGYYLKTVTIERYEGNLETGAFTGSGNLESFTIRHGTPDIGDSAFSGCSNTELSFGEGIGNVGDNAFCSCRMDSVTIAEGAVSIGENAFRGCVISEIILPSSLTEIGKGAFSSVWGLETITLPQGVTVLSERLFAGCVNLTTVNFSAELTGIGDETFRDCNALLEMQIPASVTSIGRGAFASCGRLTALTVDAENPVYCSIDGVLFDHSAETLLVCPAGKSGNYEIPESVTRIEDSAFTGCRYLTSVTIPESVTAIGNRAFYECGSLQEITVPATITGIESYTFTGCYSLQSVSLPDSLASLGTYAFRGCSRLTEIRIPSGVSGIGEYTFYECSRLKTVCIPRNVARIGCGAFMDCDSLEDILYAGEEEEWNGITIESGNDALYSAAVHYRSGTPLAQPELAVSSGETVGLDAWAETSLPEGARAVYMEFGSVDENGNFEALVREEIRNEGDRFDVLGLMMQTPGTYRFRARALTHGLDETPAGYMTDSEWTEADFTLEDTELPVIRDTDIAVSAAEFTYEEREDVICTVSGAEGIAFRMAFFHPETGELLGETDPPSSFTEGTELTIPAEMFEVAARYEISVWARFGGIWSAGGTVIEINVTPTGVLPVPTVTWADTEVEEVLELPAEAVPEMFVLHAVSAGADTLECEVSRLDPEGGSICLDTFSAEGEEGDFDLSALITEPGSYQLVFRCKKEGWTSAGNRTVTLILPVAEGDCGFELTWTLYSGGLLRISGSGSMYNYSMGYNEIPPWYAYRRQIRSVVLEDGVTSIGSDAFYECENLTGIRVPDTVQFIGGEAFYDCVHLEEITIPEGIEDIYSFTFAKCYSLTTANLPGNLEYIGEGAFLHCEKLTGIVLPAGLRHISTRAFEDCIALTEISIPGRVYEFGSGVFRDCTGLTKATVCDGVKTIPRSTFSGCSALLRIEVPASVTEIGSSAFAECVSLAEIVVDEGNEFFSSLDGVLFDRDRKTVLACPAGKSGTYTIPDGVTAIGESAFQGCAALTGVIIPAGVTEIGYGAFVSCSGLTEISIPYGVRSLDYTFPYCTGLKTVSLPYSLRTVSNNTFNRCEITDVYYTGTLEDWNTRMVHEGNSALLTAELHCLTRVFRLPENLTQLEDYALAGTNADIVYVPQGCEIIGNEVFSGCSGLRYAVIRDGALQVADGAFDGCPGLTVRTDSAFIRDLCESKGIPCEWLDDD